MVFREGSSGSGEWSGGRRERHLESSGEWDAVGLYHSRGEGGAEGRILEEMSKDTLKSLGTQCGRGGGERRKRGPGMTWGS